MQNFFIAVKQQEQYSLTTSGRGRHIPLPRALTTYYYNDQKTFIEKKDTEFSSNQGTKKMTKSATRRRFT